MPIAALPLISAGLGLIDPIAKLFAAKKQRKQARRLRKQGVEGYIPEGLQTALSETRQGAYSSRSLDQGVEEAALRKQQAGQLYQSGQVGTSSQKLAAISSTGGQFTDRMRTLQAKGQREKKGRIVDYREMLLTKANVQLGEKQQHDAAIAGLEGASMQNQYGFWSGLAEPIGNILGTIAKNKSKYPRKPKTRLSQGLEY